MQRRGFTLVEVLVASVIGAVLAFIAWPSYQGQLRRAARNEAIETLQRAQLAQERHRAAYGVYSAQLRALGLATTTPGGRYTLALETRGAEGYRLHAHAMADGGQQADGGCTTISVEVRQGFATLGPEGRCWNR
ncbi:MAG: prepilin-type N-terminal cleavage/methylation domain-containing protein [Rubrivivax sp.]|nr:prepilin-type N-terminal cleavage/methylation domain-containing protein [Rubrivivax sp.]